MATTLANIRQLETKNCVTSCQIVTKDNGMEAGAPRNEKDEMQFPFTTFIDGVEVAPPPGDDYDIDTSNGSRSKCH